MADLTGRRLGNYRLVRHLGHGGFAEVYLGEQVYLKSEAALKILLTSPKGEDVERFLLEAQTLVGLKHSNIVRVMEFGVEGAIPFLVMDYAPGGTTRQRYPTGTRLPLATTVAYIKQAAGGLQYAHNRGIIHRDVKPENILLDFDQHILLSDFGLALFAPSPELLSTQEGAGTPLYMPPEQLQGKPTFASDQYSLAVVTYEWLCGKRLFEGDRWALFHQHMYVAPLPLRQSCPDLPAAVDEVILRALAKDPQQRFTSIQAFSLALERASHVNAAAMDDDFQITVPLRDLSPSAEVTPTATKHSRYGSPAQRRVFLTAAPADEAFAARLQADLHVRGILVSHNHSMDIPGANQQDALRQVIRDATIALVVVSPHTRSSRTIKEQVRVVSMYQRHLVFVWAAGDDVAAALPEAWGRTAMIDLVDAREARYQLALDEILAFLAEESPTGILEESILAVPAGEPRNPYKGLRAFTGDDAADFFGRDTLIEELAETIEGSLTAEKHNVPTARLLTVIGPSGSGKSSVVMAGLLPGLQRAALPGSEAWVYLDPIVPGKRPLESLTLAFAPHLPERSLRAIRHDLEDDSARGLHLLATRLVKRAGARVVLMIDQFEELFAQTVSERERQHFIDLLVAAVTEPVGSLVVLLTLRADFYDRPMHYPQLSQLIETHQKSVLPMNLRDLRAVIEQPAALPDVQLLFEGDLVGDLLFEAQGQAGALPLLEFTLDQLFRQRDGHWLTREAYQQIGGVKGALAKHAESTYASLPSDEHRHLARALFLRLIDPGVTEQDTTRRRAALSELSLPNPKQTAIMREVADAFVNARLLMTNEVAGTTTIEVSHEALIREWARLAEWLREAREDITLQQAISADAAEWVRRGRPIDRLYRGTQLTEAQVWAERNVPNADEVDFLHAGAVEHEYQEDVTLNQKMRELDLQRRAVNRLRLLITTFTVFSVLSIVLASATGVTLLQVDTLHKQASLDRQLANQQLQIARSDGLVADASISLAEDKLDQALLLSIKATQIASTSEARDSLLGALENNPQIVSILRSGAPYPLFNLAFGSDDRTLVSSDGYNIYTWNTQTKQDHPLQLDNQTYFGGVALSSDNRTLATSSGDGVWLWNIQTGTQLAQLDGSLHTNAPSTLVPRTTITFSSDGMLVASGRCTLYSLSESIPLCIKTQISVWDISVNPPHLIGSFVVPADVKSIAFSPDGKTLATGSDIGIQLWSVATSLASPLTRSAGTNSVAFSPDGTILAAGNNDDTIQLWKVSSGQLADSPVVLVGHTGPITSVAFSPDSQSQLLASSSEDRTVRLWNVTSRTTILTLNGDPQQKLSVAFTSDGKTLASGSADGTIILWDVTAQNTISKPLANIGGLLSPVFSTDGTKLFTGSANGKIFLQNVATGRFIQMLDTTRFPATPIGKQYGNPLAIESLALGGKGKILASGRLDGTIVLWDTQKGEMLREFGKANPLYKIVLSSNGQVLASSGEGDTITIWDAAKGSVLYSLPYHSNKPFSKLPIALSLDGKVLAVGGCGKMSSDGSCEQGQVQLWDVTTGKIKGQALLGHTSAVQDVAFSPDGHTLASSSRDAVILWNLTTEKPGSQTLSLPIDPSTYYSHMVFSLDGQMLALVSAFGSPFSFVLWDRARNELFAHPISQQDTASLSSIALSPDGQQLVSVSLLTNPPHNGIFTLWDISIKLWREHACSIANRNLTQDEWKQFISYLPYGKVCTNLPT